jgi:phospholipase C
LGAPAWAAAPRGKRFDRAIFVLFENTNYAKAAAQPFLRELGAKGAIFTGFEAQTHPSQPNYIALTAGALHGVKTNGNVDLAVEHVADLLEEKGLTWKVYAEDYPGKCYRGGSYKDYARKHNPFISYLNVQRSPERCVKIVPAEEFDIDRRAGKLPNYVFYIPNGKNDGHDTGVGFADKWYRAKFGPLVNDQAFMSGTILISTFDESGGGRRNQIYTSIVGPAVKPGENSGAHNHYSLLRMIRDNWDLRSLNLEDARASSLDAIWN